MITLRHLSVTLLITAALSALTVTRAQDDRPPSGGLPPPTHDYDGCPPPTKELCEVDRPQECQDSSTCKPGHKCCPISCNGLQCMAVEPAIEPAEKPGQCLAHIMGCPDDQPRDPIDCNNDYECPDELKCCSTPCFGRTCQHPDFAVVDPPQEEGKPGQCEDPKKELSLCMKGVYENSTADCSIDKDCSGNLKCCEQTCVKPKCKPPMKPGECPMHIMGCPAGQEADGVDCNADEDCKGSLKCCSTGCFGKRCQAPQPVVNPGECPMTDLPDSPCEPGAQKEDLCSDDGSCKPGQKCCPQCMGKRCVNAEPIVDPPPPLGKPGQCDDFAGIAARCLRDSYENSTAECDNDFNCKGNMKCCRQLCVKPLCKPPLKPGSCPMTVQGCREGQTDPINCSEDFDCSGNLKCCYTGCGGRACVAPEYEKPPPPPPPPPQEKPGECIVSRRACLDPTNIPKDECSVDIDCKGDLKCCRAPCGNMVCSEPYLPPPPEVKPGQCVRLMIACLNKTGIPKDACSVDGDCKGDDKCCPQPCGNLICTQTSQPPPPDVSGQCPSEPIRTDGGGADGGSVGICAFLCNNDSSCGKGQKCCRNECGGTVCQTLDEQQSCPMIAPPVRPCLNNCFDDSQCGSDERCCKNDCGGKQCYNVNGGGNSGGESPKVIPQACPYFDPRRVCAKANPRDCEPGSRCKDGSLCCEYECGGARCQPVLCPSYREYQCVTTEPQQCNATDQCHTKDICCSGSCSGRKCQSTAAVPIEQPPKVYPRACPYFDPNRVCLLPKPRDCEPGSTCSDGSLCCEYECDGARCQPVLCPGYPALQCFTRDPLRCNATDHCGSDAICCDGACSGRSCVATGTDVKPPPPAAAPVCPVFDRKVVCKDKRSPYNCNPQDRCVNGGKCCEQECGGTQCSPGLCPAPDKNINCLLPESRDCESSSTCGEGQVCCEIHCGGTRCQSPTGLGYGGVGAAPKEEIKTAEGGPVCPSPAAKPVCSDAMKKRACQSDSECGSRKCCDTGCNVNICQTPVRPGSCPPLRDMSTIRCRAPTEEEKQNQCGTDMACPGTQKCCESECPGFGKVCKDSVY